MRVLTIGRGGMLGDNLAQAGDDRVETWVTFRSDALPSRPGIFEAGRCLGGVDAVDMSTVARAVARVRPDMVVNCPDCVFSGRRGGYLETDPPDGEGLNGRTKLFGEPKGGHPTPLAWPDMVREITPDPTPHDDWSRAHVS